MQAGQADRKMYRTINAKDWYLPFTFAITIYVPSPFHLFSNGGVVAETTVIGRQSWVQWTFGWPSYPSGRLSADELSKLRVFRNSDRSDIDIRFDGEGERSREVDESNGTCTAQDDVTGGAHRSRTLRRVTLLSTSPKESRLE